MTISNLHAWGGSASTIKVAWDAYVGATSYEVRHRLYLSDDPPGLSVDLNYGSPDDFTAVNGQTDKIHVSNQASYTLNGHKAKVTWNRTYDKFQTTYIYLNNITTVNLTDIHILATESEYVHYHSIYVTNCDVLNISKCSFHGAAWQYHIRTENVKEIYIDNVEVKGYNYGSVTRTGGGIWIVNGNYVTPATELEYLEIKHCWFHDHLSNPTAKNQDGILIESASNSLLEALLFEDWVRDDGALDISHRRQDEVNYSNKTSTVKNCKFVNCRAAKCSGGYGATNKILFENIESIDTSWHYYAYIYEIKFTNCTFVETFPSTERFIGILGQTSNVTYENCQFTFARGLYRFLHDNYGSKDSYLGFNFTDCIWYANDADITRWVEAAVIWTSWSDFSNSALVTNGTLITP